MPYPVDRLKYFDVVHRTDRFAIVRMPTIGRTVHWFIYQFSGCGQFFHPFKQYRSLKQAKAVLERFETMPKELI